MTARYFFEVSEIGIVLKLINPKANAVLNASKSLYEEKRSPFCCSMHSRGCNWRDQGLRAGCTPDTGVDAGLKTHRYLMTLRRRVNPIGGFASPLS